MVKIIKDIDIYDHFNEYDVILIGTNLYCTMSQGVQLKVMLNYPYVFNKNLETKYGDKDKLGTIIECTSDNEPTFCLCFITEGYNFRPDKQKDYLSYEALENTLKLVNVRYKGKSIACPLLGSSRFDGNGDKDKILDIFNNCLKDVKCTVFDYFQKSRDEETLEVMRKELEMRDKDKEEYSRMVKERKRKAEERFRKNGHRRY
jgi:hypothetical protein